MVKLGTESYINKLGTQLYINNWLNDSLASVLQPCFQPLDFFAFHLCIFLGGIC